MALNRIPLAIAGSILALVGCTPERRLDAMEGKVRIDYPAVRQLETGALSDWLADSTRTQPLVLDIRDPEEYRVSHLAGALSVPPGDGLVELGDVDHDTPIVVYCSVGVRSSEMAVRLTGLGFTNVQNLEGSIFRWANEGRPLSGGATVVHPYNARWGKLLRKEARATVANAPVP